eukprot:2841219-Rhodomonas_salina.1
MERHTGRAHRSTAVKCFLSVCVLNLIVPSTTSAQSQAASSILAKIRLSLQGAKSSKVLAEIEGPCHEKTAGADAEHSIHSLHRWRRRCSHYGRMCVAL